MDTVDTPVARPTSSAVTPGGSTTMDAAYTAAAASTVGFRPAVPPPARNRSNIEAAMRDTLAGTPRSLAVFGKYIEGSGGRRLLAERAAHHSIVHSKFGYIRGALHIVQFPRQSPPFLTR